MIDDLWSPQKSASAQPCCRGYKKESKEPRLSPFFYQFSSLLSSRCTSYRAGPRDTGPWPLWPLCSASWRLSGRRGQTLLSSSSRATDTRGRGCFARPPSAGKSQAVFQSLQRQNAKKGYFASSNAGPGLPGLAISRPKNQIWPFLKLVGLEVFEILLCSWPFFKSIYVYRVKSKIFLFLKQSLEFLVINIWQPALGLAKDTLDKASWVIYIDR